MSRITLKALGLAACFAFAGLTTLARAEESKPVADKPEAKTENKAVQADRGRPANFLLNLRAAKSMALTDEQTSKIAELEKEYRDKMQELRRAAQTDDVSTGSEPGGGRAAMREAVRKLNAEFEPKFDAILTAEQKTELKSKIEEMMSQRGVRGEGRRGRPQTDEQEKP